MLKDAKTPAARITGDAAADNIENKRKLVSHLLFLSLLTLSLLPRRLYSHVPFSSSPRVRDLAYEVLVMH
jgi:hypothetical protein